MDALVPGGKSVVTPPSTKKELLLKGSIGFGPPQKYRYELDRGSVLLGWTDRLFSSIFRVDE
jgi:hypothetical protein